MQEPLFYTVIFENSPVFSSAIRGLTAAGPFHRLVYLHVNHTEPCTKCAVCARERSAHEFVQSSAAHTRSLANGRGWHSLRRRAKAKPATSTQAGGARPPARDARVRAPAHGGSGRRSKVLHRGRARSRKERRRDGEEELWRCMRARGTMTPMRNALNVLSSTPVRTKVPR